MLTNIEESDVQLYIDHLHYFFSVQSPNNIKNLTEEEKIRLFLLLHENADLFSKIILPSTSSFLQYILGEKTEEQVTSENDIEFVQAYKLWKQSQTQ
jgi:hypothetical protein